MKNRPFENLGTILSAKREDAAVSGAQDAEKEKADRQKRFLKIMEGNYDKLPASWKFTSKLPDVIFTSIIKQVPGENLSIYVRYKTKDGGEDGYGYTFSLFKDGVLSGKTPKDFPISKEQLYEDVLYNLEAIGLDFWYNDREKILEKRDQGTNSKGELMEKEDGKEQYEDPRRIEFLRKQPDALFGFHGRLTNYKGFVFKGNQNSFIFMENPDVGNALFILNLEKSITDEEAKKCKDTKDTTTRKKIVERYWKQHEDKSKSELERTPQVERVVHARVDNWISQVKDLLNSRNPLPDIARNVALTKRRQTVN